MRLIKPVVLPEIKPAFPAVESWSLNHWTARDGASLMIARGLNRLIFGVKGPETPVTHFGTQTSHLTALHAHFLCNTEAALPAIPAAEDSCVGAVRVGWGVRGPIQRPTRGRCFRPDARTSQLEGGHSATSRLKGSYVWREAHSQGGEHSPQRGRSKVDICRASGKERVT